MPLRRVCRFECDAPGCRLAFVSTHTETARAREHVLAWGWSILRWRIPCNGVKRFKGQAGFTSVADTGGGVRKLYRCPSHTESNWRPRRGREVT